MHLSLANESRYSRGKNYRIQERHRWQRRCSLPANNADEALLSRSVETEDFSGTMIRPLLATAIMLSTTSGAVALPADESLVKSPEMVTHVRELLNPLTGQ